MSKVIHRGVKIKLYLTNEQKRSIVKHANACRFIWNYYLPIIHKHVSNGRKKPSFNELSSMLTELKKNEEFFWLNKVNRNPLVNTLETLSNGYDNYISSYVLNKPIKFEEPRFKSVKRDVLSFKYNQPETIKLNKTKTKIRLPSIGYVRFRGYRDNFINSRIMSITIKVYPCGDIEATYTVECENQTSTTCSCCGVIDRSNRVKEVYACKSCGSIMDTDHNAAINIMRKGISIKY